MLLGTAAQSEPKTFKRFHELSSHVTRIFPHPHFLVVFHQKLIFCIFQSFQGLGIVVSKCLFEHALYSLFLGLKNKTIFSTEKKIDNERRIKTNKNLISTKLINVV